MIVPALQLWVSTTVLFDGTPSFARVVVNTMGGCMRGVGHTSQWFRIAERPPAMDLRGGKASEDSFTRLTANLVAEYTVDPRLVVFSYAALGSTV